MFAILLCQICVRSKPPTRSKGYNDSSKVPYWNRFQDDQLLSSPFGRVHNMLRDKHFCDRSVFGVGHDLAGSMPFEGWFEGCGAVPGRMR
jgi:hypothetical protein